MGSHRRNVVVICCSAVTLPTIIRVTLKWNLRKDCRNAADVVEMVVADVEVVDMLYAKLIQVRNGFGAIVFLHVFANIKQHHLSAWRDQYRSISLTNIHVVNLELSIGLSIGDSDENQHANNKG